MNKIKGYKVLTYHPYDEWKITSPLGSSNEVHNTWSNGTLKAACVSWLFSHLYDQIDTDSVAHDAPSENCRCGIYAVKDLYTDSINSILDFLDKKDCILVEVELSGSIFEYEYGYRAELAKITGVLGASNSTGKYSKWDYPLSLFHYDYYRRKDADYIARMLNAKLILHW